MIPIEPSPTPYVFPNPETGRGEQGIVCVGGDFAPGTLLTAYRRGIFPWPISRALVPWCSPNPRAVFPLDRPPHWSRSLRRSLRHKPFRISVDTAFAQVIAGCADRPEGSWITPEYKKGYIELHRLGWAHSVEVWNVEDERLVGGIYGIAVGGMFAGESMFHRETDASKVAFAALVSALRRSGYTMLDVQVLTDHLASLGCVAVPRRVFLRRLAAAMALSPQFPTSATTDIESA